MFKKFAKDILVETADDCYISSIKSKNKKELEDIAGELLEISTKVEGEVLADLY